MTFEWPTLLLSLALIPLLAVVYLLAQRRRRAYAVRFTNLALLSSVVGRGPGIRRHVPPLLFLLGMAALLVSLARPQAVVAVPREQAAVMLVLDVSGSMAAEDLNPSRMTAAKQAADKFIASLPTNLEVGVVSFSTSARLVTPLTHDFGAARRAVSGLSAEGGTAIGDGLSLALDELKQRPLDANGEPAPALVVLLSDGEQTNGQVQPQTAATRARDQNVTVHTVGIGQRGAQARVNNGRQTVGLDERTLQQIAQTAGGEYFYAAESSELAKIYGDLGSRISWTEERTEVTALASGAGAILLLIGGLLGLRWFQQFP